MQNTRLNTIANVLGERLWRWLSNPWRRISLFAISLCVGFLFGSVAITTAGQTASWDLISALLSVAAIEAVSMFVYRTAPRREALTQVLPRRLLGIDMMNAFKVGFTFSLFLDAYKLGS